MADTRRLTIEVLGDAKNAMKALGDVGDKAGKIGQDFVDFGKKVALGFAAFSAGAVVIGKQLVDAASDLNEVTSKTNVVFGDAADSVLKFADGADVAFGQSKKQALDAASTFGIFGKAAGLSGQDLGDFSTSLVGLASDMASFSNTSPQEAIDALGAALRGESEPIRRYGVMLDDASLKAQAMSMGIYDGNGSLTQQQKILAAQALIFKQTSDAQGDFARTSDGMANQQRILAARLENTKAKLGQALLPIALKVMSAFSDLIDKVAPLAERYLPRLAAVLQTAADKAMDIANAVGKFLAPYIEKLGDWMKDNIDVVKVFFGVIAGAAAIAGVVALGAAIAGLFNPLTLIIGAIAALVAGFYMAYTRSEEFRAVVDAVVAFFRDKVVPAFQAAFSAIISGVQSFIEGFSARMDNMRTILEGIRGFIEMILGVIMKAWQLFGDDIMRYIGTIFDAIRNIIEGTLKVIKGVIDFFLGVLSGDWGRAWEGIRDIVSGILNVILGLIRSATAPIVAAFGFITSSLGAGLWGLWEIVTKAFGAIWNVAYSVFDRIRSFVSTIFLGIVDTIKAVINGMLGFLERGINLVVDGINHIIWSFEWVNGSADFPRLSRVRLPRLADGGIVTAPTIAMIGEAGPEAVVPLTGRNAPMGGDVIVNVAGSVTSERDLIETIRRGLVNSQRNGAQLVYSNT